MQHLSENVARPRIGRALGRVAAVALLSAAVLFQPGLAQVRTGVAVTAVVDSTAVDSMVVGLLDFTVADFTAAGSTAGGTVASRAFIIMVSAATIGTTAGTTDATAGGCGDPGWHGPYIRIPNRTPRRAGITAQTLQAITPT